MTMALGILEPKVEHVPGTVFVYESEQRHARAPRGWSAFEEG